MTIRHQFGCEHHLHLYIRLTCFQYHIAVLRLYYISFFAIYKILWLRMCLKEPTVTVMSKQGKHGSVNYILYNITRTITFPQIEIQVLIQVILVRISTTRSIILRIRSMRTPQSKIYSFELKFGPCASTSCNGNFRGFTVIKALLEHSLWDYICVGMLMGYHVL